MTVHGRAVIASVLVLIASLVSLPIASVAWAAEYVSVKKDGVNIRSGPSPKDEILWEVFKDFPLEVVKKKADWMQIKDFEGDTGWIASQMVAKKKTVIVKTDKVNMRVGPGTNYEVVASVKYGVVFEPKEKDGEWIKVVHEDGTTGWLNQKLIWPPNPL